MEATTVIQENWFTKKPSVTAYYITAFMSLLIVLGSYLFLADVSGANDLMAASNEEIFKNKQYWRLWTALFAHSDLGHLFSNLLLFVPFSYFLSAYFGVWFFPVLGFLFGGVTNYFVLQTMSEKGSLIGVSGVVYWMAASWLTLFLLIDRRQSVRRRIAKVFLVIGALLLPETYKPQISYLSHFIGFIFGILSGLIFYFFNAKRIHAAEVLEYIYDEDVSYDFEASSKPGAQISDI